MEESKHPFDPDLPTEKTHLRGDVFAGKETEASVISHDVLLKQMIKEDPKKGFELIFRKYYQPLCSHAIRFVYSRQAAEDIVSDVFLTFWNKKLFETVNGSYKTYLYVAVRNKAFNYVKSEFGENAVKPAVDGNEILPEDNNPETILLYDELFSTIGETVKSFSPQCRRVFILSRFEGKKNREIAADLNIRLKTVEAHMMKALAILKKSVHNYFN